MDDVNIIHFLKADAGDCILLQLEDKKCILIDCGYKSTFENELKPLLKKLAIIGYRISLLIITHYDEDHIQGANALLKENGDYLNPIIIEIDEIWFNGIFNIVRSSSKIQTHIVEKLSIKYKDKYRLLQEQLLGLIGVGEGEISANLAETFELLCTKNNYKVNAVTNGGRIVAGTKTKIGEYTIKCLNPGYNQFDKLEKWIDNTCTKCLGKNYELDKNNFIMFLQNMLLANGREPQSYLTTSKIGANIPDIKSWFETSTRASMNVVNRASIVVEITYKSKKLLFAADSESADWITNAYKEYDYVKISHHGTTKPNIELLEKVKISVAMISTNGKRNHPEDELLARLIQANVNEIYFNYDIRRKRDLTLLEKQYGFKAHFGNPKIYF